MNKTVTAALALSALALSAPAGALPDVRTDGGTTWARFGSLGRNDYVVTNAPPSFPSPPAALPKYLRECSFDDSYPDAAAEYYRSRGDGRVDGGCSAVRDGGFVYRNFDFPFDDRAEFVVRMSAGAGRFASVGVAQVGTNLTEAIVTSGDPRYSARYKWLPGATVDGVNENGVVCEINVVGGDPHENGWPSNGTVHCLGAVRHVLDSATTARSAASDLVDRLFFPAGFSQNFHWMIADATETWIVENGVASNVTAVAAKRVMTNFPILPDTYDGMGRERYDILRGPSNITNAWYTKAYRRETTPPWVSEFSADVLARTNEIFNAWASHPREYFRGKTNGGEPWWQTVHTSVYDIQNRVLRLAVQETDDWYVFQVPSVGKVKSVNGFTGDVNLGASDVGALPVGHVDERIVSTNMTLRSGYPGHTEMNADGSITERPDPAYAVHENPIPYIPNTITGTTTGADAGTILTYEYDGVSDGVFSWTCRLEPKYWTDTWYGYSCPSNLLFRSSDETWVMRTGNGQSVDFPTADFSPYKVMTAQTNLVGSYRMGSRTMVWKAAPATWSSVQASGYTPSYPHFETNVFPVTRTRVLRRDDISDWALQPAKPEYTPFEIGALPFSRYLTTKTYLADYDHIDCFGLGSVYYNASLEMESNGSAYENFFSITRQGGMASDWVPLITNTQYRSEGIRHRCYRTSFGTIGTFDYFLWFPHEDGTIATREWVQSEGITETDPVWNSEKSGYVPWANDSHNAVTIGSRESGSVIGEGSLAQGSHVNATGLYSRAEGDYTYANGDYSHAEGNSSYADGDHSHAEGDYTSAEGVFSHSEGSGTHAGGAYSHAEGYNTSADGDSSHAEGDNTVADGDYSHAEGSGTHANGDYSHAEGYNTRANGSFTHAEGGETIAGRSDGNLGRYAHAAGFNAHATNTTAFAWNGSAKDNPSASGASVDYVPPYGDHGNGTYNINPVGGLYGFWIGETNLGSILEQYVSREEVVEMVNTTKSRFFDSGLGVEWTFVPMNGEFMFIATTNVNREVIE